MTICHLVYECFPHAYSGGVQKMVFELALAQAARGDTVEIWTVGDLPEVLCAERVRLRYFPGRARWSSSVLRERLLVEVSKFDVVHSHNTFLPLNRLAERVAKAGARVFFHAHGAIDPFLLSGLTIKAKKKALYVRLVERQNYDAGAGVFGLTEEECRQFAAMRTRTAIFEVSNGISPTPNTDPIAIAEFRLKHRIPAASPIILFVGRIIEKKGIHLLLTALPIVLGHFPDAVLTICGDRNQDTDYVRSLDDQLNRTGLEQHVRWVGFLDEQGKRAAFAAAAVFAHPSYSEGMALAVLEAMAVGLPTIVTPGCYMDKAVRAGALSLATMQPANIAEKIIELLENRRQADALGQAAASFVRAHHSWAVVAERLAQIYAGNPAVAPFRPALNG